jgi:hypothetical protein
MTTTTHSPGPWIIETRLHVHAIKDANGQDLTYQDTEPQPDAGSVTSRGKSANETLANARLIAAAPQMLEALRAALEAMGDTYDARDAAGTEGEQLRDQIAEAIAAATGEPANY